MVNSTGKIDEGFKVDFIITTCPDDAQLALFSSLIICITNVAHAGKINVDAKFVQPQKSLWFVKISWRAIMFIDFVSKQIGI